MLYEMMSLFGSRLVCWQFEQLVVHDVLSRQKHFFNHFNLERSLAAFAFVNNTAYLIGGVCTDRNQVVSEVISQRKMVRSERQIIPYPFDVDRGTFISSD
jgi:hypothetical protein